MSVVIALVVMTCCFWNGLVDIVSSWKTRAGVQELIVLGYLQLVFSASCQEGRLQYHLERGYGSDLIFRRDVAALVPCLLLISPCQYLGALASPH